MTRLTSSIATACVRAKEHARKAYESELGLFQESRCLRQEAV